MNTLGDGKVKISREQSSNKSIEKKHVLKEKPCVLDATDVIKTVTRAIMWLAKALEAQVCPKYFGHGSAWCWASFRSMKIFCRYGPAFLIRFPWNSGWPWHVQTKSVIYFKGREVWQILHLVYLALASLWCFSEECSGRKFFFAHHYNAVFFCSNKFSGTIVSRVSVRLMQWSNTVKELIKLLIEDNAPPVPHREPVQTYNSYYEILF